MKSMCDTFLMLLSMACICGETKKKKKIFRLLYRTNTHTHTHTQNTGNPIDTQSTYQLPPE